MFRLSFSVLVGVLVGIGAPAVKRKVQINGVAQGTTYHVTYFAPDSFVTKEDIQQLLATVDSSLSIYKEYSLVSRFNRSPDSVKMDDHFRKVVKKALQVYKETGGQFDITILPLTNAWGFGPQRQDSLPGQDHIQALLPCVDSRLLQIKGNYLWKKQPCVQLDPNGIAQGYTVDLLALLLEKAGIKDYIVELGGEIRVKGRKFPGNEKMSIGIESPGDDPFSGKMERLVWLDKGAITTSGNYRRYRESGGRRFGHLLNPKTGYPVSNDLISVTVYAKDAMTADAFDNALMGMGLRKAFAFVQKRKDISAHFIYLGKDGVIADTMTAGFRRLLKP